MPSFLTKNIFFPLDQRLKGFDVLGALRQLEASQWYSESEIRNFQRDRILILMTHSNNKIKFYRDLFEKYSIRPDRLDDFFRIPFLTKNLCKESFQDLLVPSKERYQKRSTSGSTGQPKITFSDYRAVSFHKAALLRGRRWWHMDNGDEHVMVWSSKREPRFLEKMRELIVKNKILLPLQDLREEKIKDIYRMLLIFKPKYLYGISNGLFNLVTLLKENNLGIKHRIKGVIYTSETLFPHQKRVIEEYFGAPCINEYGCSEFFNIAFQCPAGSLHIAADNLFVEVVRRDGSPCSCGEMGHLVITDLNNLAMPHIRYWLGDMGTLIDEACPCGRLLPVMKLSIARETEMIKLKNGHVLHSFIFQFPLSGPFYANIKQFRIMQKSYEDFHVELVTDPRFKDEIRKHYLVIAEKYFPYKVKFHLKFVDSIPLEPSGKLRYFFCEIP